MVHIPWRDRLKGCLVLGAVGDALGNPYEGQEMPEVVVNTRPWCISDDTQMCLATCEAIYQVTEIEAGKIADRFLAWYNMGKLTGLGASTLKALRELQMGAHWSQVGRRGAYAAGNGAAMRIAPLAYKKEVDRFTLLDVCRITHRNDEAYAGALALFLAIRYIIDGHWLGGSGLLDYLVDQLPDTLVRDRMVALQAYTHLDVSEIGKIYKNTGYAVDSVPLALFCAQQFGTLSLEDLMLKAIRLGGDTDTLCAMMGQVLGTLLGEQGIPAMYRERFLLLPIAPLVDHLCLNWVY